VAFKDWWTQRVPEAARERRTALERDREYTKQMITARAREAAAEFNTALAAARDANRAKPDEPEAAGLIASLLARTARTDDALRWFATALDLGFGPLDQLMTAPEWTAIRGSPSFLMLVEEARYTRFRTLLEEAHKLDNEVKFDVAAGRVREALKLFDNDPNAYLLLASIRVRNAEPLEGLAMFSEALERGLRNPKAILEGDERFERVRGDQQWRAIIDVWTEGYAQAEDARTRAAAATEPSEKLAAYTEALTLDPSDVQSRIEIARIAASTAPFDSALPWIRGAFAFGYADFDAVVKDPAFRGLRASEGFTELVRLWRVRRFIVHRDAAERFAAATKLSESIAAYKLAVAVIGDDTRCLYNYACVLSRSGDLEGALTQLNAAVTAGFDDLELLASDHDLDPIRSNPKFRALLERAKVKPDDAE
jgi:tetratricopeptide (TPR) repeat protein